MTAMKKKPLAGDKFLLPSAAGAYHLLCYPSQTPAARLFSSILAQKETRVISAEEAKQIMKLDSEEAFATVMHDIFASGWLEEHDVALRLPDDPLEELLPQLLTVLSTTGHTFLSDSHGFPLFSSGFSRDDEEALSVMTAEFSTIYEKHRAVIQDNIDSPTQAWGMIDVTGQSNMGIYPITIGHQSFNLLVQGRPRLDHPNFVILAWLLYSRYFNASYHP